MAAKRQSTLSAWVKKSISTEDPPPKKHKDVVETDSTSEEKGEEGIIVHGENITENVVIEENQNNSGENLLQIHSVSIEPAKPSAVNPINTIADSFVHKNTSAGHFIYCKVCSKFPAIVKRYNNRNRAPPITESQGTRYKSEVATEHLKSLMHNKCLEANNFQEFKTQKQAEPPVELLTSNSIVSKISTLDYHFSKSNEKLFNHIGSLLYVVYNDSKKLTLSAWSFPSRVYSSTMARDFDCNNFFVPTCEQEGKNFCFNYVSPTSHRELQTCIVESESDKILNDILLSIASSLRCDGSVDRTQNDKIFVSLKIVEKCGNSKDVFLGVATINERGAIGMYNSVKEAIECNFQEKSKKIIDSITSVVTDGAAINTGEKNGLWGLMRKEREVSDSQKPLITIWCAVHRSQLAWENACKIVPELQKQIMMLNGISSFFHQSGLRTRELHKLAEENNLSVFSMPEQFDVRWTEFTFTLYNNILTSWHAITLYLRNCEDVKGKGMFKYLTDLTNLQLMTFTADVLSLYQFFQKSMQSNSATLVTLSDAVSSVITEIKKLESTKLIGGWESAFEKELVSNSDVTSLKGIVLSEKEHRYKKSHNKYVSDNRNLEAVKNEIICSLIEFLQQRFEMDTNLISVIKQFLSFDKSVNVNTLHSMLSPDLDLCNVNLEYNDLCNNGIVKGKSLSEAIFTIANIPTYRNVFLIMTRILAAKPHSADVERIISADNLVKTSLRSSILTLTENYYLFIHFNLPPLALWDPRPSLLCWIKSKNRRQKSTPLGKDQAYYKGVFSSATIKSKASDSDTSKKVIPRKF